MSYLGEQLTLNQWVLGSSPRWCTKKSLTENVGLFFIAITRNVELVHHRVTMEKKQDNDFQLPLASVIGEPLQAAAIGQQMMVSELMQKTPEQLGVADGESGDSQKAEK